MTSLQNHLRQLSGNKQNKKVAFKEGDFFLFLYARHEHCLMGASP